MRVYNETLSQDQANAMVMPEPSPPPPPLLEAAFEDNDGGFTVSTAGGTS